MLQKAIKPIDIITEEKVIPKYLKTLKECLTLFTIVAFIPDWL